MKKLSQFVDKIVPLISAAAEPDMLKGNTLYKGEIDDLSRLISQFLKNTYDYKDKNCLNVELVLVSDEVAEQFSKELDFRSFSFDVKFEDCQGLLCTNWRSRWEPSSENGRPVVTVRHGQTPAFLVFVDGNLSPLVCMNLYHKDFNAWAKRIDLRGTRQQRTNNPSTHFVYREHAEEVGLLWFNRDTLRHYSEIKSIGKLGFEEPEEYIVVEFDILDHEYHHKFNSLEQAVDRLEHLEEVAQIDKKSSPTLAHPDGSGRLWDIIEKDWM